jgi:hypothetical protein
MRPSTSRTRARSPDDVLELVAILELAREERDLARETAVVERLADLHEQLLLGERLLDVVERAVPHRLDGALDRAVRGHDDDLGHRLCSFTARRTSMPSFEPIRRSVEDEVERACAPRSHPSSPVLRFRRPRTPRAKHHRERGAHVALVVDDEELRHV